MVFNNEKISPKQLYRLIIIATLGITCILETELCVGYAGGYGIYCLLFQLLLTVIYTGLILFICEKYRWNLNGMKNGFIKKRLRTPIYFIFMMRYFLLTVFVISYLIKLVREDLLKEMGYIGILIPTISIIIYSVSKGMETRARLAEIMIYFIFIFILILPVFSFENLNFEYVIQAKSGDLKGIFIGGTILFLLFSPVEIILFMMNKFSVYLNGEVNDNWSKLYKRAVWNGIFTTFIINLIYYVVCTGVVSINVIMAKNKAVTLLAKNVKMPYLVFERQDGIFMAFFVISIFFTAFCLAHQTIFLGEKLYGKINKYSYIATIIFLFIGCFLVINNVDYFTGIKGVKEKRVEIENRDYADSIYIDYDKEKFQVALIFPNEKSIEDIMKFELDNLKDINEEYSKKSNKSLDMSQVQVVLINKNIISNEKIFKNIFYFFESDEIFSDNMVVCGVTQNVDEFADNVKKIKVAPGRFINKMLENNNDIDKLKLRDLRFIMLDTVNNGKMAVFEAKNGRMEYLEGMLLE